jgi:hypothetical protein
MPQSGYQIDACSPPPSTSIHSSTHIGIVAHANRYGIFHQADGYVTSFSCYSCHYSLIQAPVLVSVLGIDKQAWFACNKGSHQAPVTLGSFYPPIYPSTYGLQAAGSLVRSLVTSPSFPRVPDNNVAVRACILA